MSEKLGPLPEPAERERVYGGHGNEIVHEYYSANQMREYARQHVFMIDDRLKQVADAALVYFRHYMQDEAEDEDDCVCGRPQHERAAALRDALINAGLKIEPL